MKINEILFESSDIDSNLITALELLKSKHKDDDAIPPLSVASIVNLVKNISGNFSREQLQHAFDNNPTVQSLIKSIDGDVVTLNGEDTASTKEFDLDFAPDETEEMPDFDEEPIDQLGTEEPMPTMGNTQPNSPTELPPSEQLNFDTTLPPVDTVGDMAKRAKNRRSI
jgi:hypothetical protein